MSFNSENSKACLANCSFNCWSLGRPQKTRCRMHRTHPTPTSTQRGQTRIRFCRGPFCSANLLVRDSSAVLQESPLIASRLSHAAEFLQAFLRSVSSRSSPSQPPRPEEGSRLHPFPADVPQIQAAIFRPLRGSFLPRGNGQDRPQAAEERMR